MTTAEVGSRLVSLCQQFKNIDAIQELYADDIVNVEAMPDPSGSFELVGKEAVLAKNVEWLAAHEIHSASTEGPYPGTDKFSVIFDLDVTHKASGNHMKMREVGVYTVKDGKIVREEFMYGMG